jgi:hypothetical protein
MHVVPLHRPKLKMQMEYCMSHPEEISKVASVQKKVREVPGSCGGLHAGTGHQNLLC